MEISVRDPQNHMIKPSCNGRLVSVFDSVTQKLLISDKILRSFTPPQLRKMATKLRQICECELCIITKDMQIDLNRFRTRLVTYLQKKYVGIHTCNSLFITKSDAHYKEKVFPDGEFLYAAIKYEAQCITCLSIKTNNMVNIKCALGFCDECPDYNLWCTDF